MRLQYDEDTERFRAEFDAWLDEHMPTAEDMHQRAESSAHIPEWARQWQRALFDDGWLVPGWPPELGGRNATPVQQMVYFEELARRQLWRSQNIQGLTIFAPSVIDYGTDEQKQRWALPVLRAEKTTCIGMSEPGAGSDLAGLSTRAELRGDSFVINGQKVWTSGAHHSDFCICFVRTNLDAPKHRGISALLLDMDTPGITTRPFPSLIDRGSWIDFNEVFFDDVVVPRENLLGTLDDGWRVANASLGHERGMLWITESARLDLALERALAEALREDSSGARLADKAGVRNALVDAYVDATALRCLGYRGFAKFSQGKPAPEHILLKLFGSEANQELFLNLAEGLGANALDVEDPPEVGRMGEGWPWVIRYLSSFGTTISGGTSEIQRNIIAERVLGLPRQALAMVQARQDLEQFFHPDGVAILGRVDREADGDALLAEYRARYGTDRVYLVNPKGGSVGDVPVYESVVDIADPVGLAIINVGPQLCAAALRECGRKGIPYALIFTSGFSEVGPDGAALEAELAAVAREHGIRVFGPNTNTNAFERLPEIAGLRGGKIGLLTQSGHNGRPVVQGALFGVGFTRWVPTGNEVDLEAADFLEYFAYDDETAVIAGYFEGFKDPAKLRRALEAANANAKPVVALKIGSTAAGSRMASSHTGHLTGADGVVNGLFAQHGVTRVRDLDELLETAALFAKLPPGTGPNVCLYSISGGSGTLMGEIAETVRVPTPPLADDTQARLHELIPTYLTVTNPVDNGGQFLGSPQEQRLRVLELLTADPAVDVIVVGITGALGAMTDNLGADLLAFAPTAAKPVIVTWNSPKTDEQGFADVVASGVPVFRSFRNCFAALRAYADYQQQAHAFRARQPVEPSPAERSAADAALGSPGTLDTPSARALLESFGLPLVREALVTSAAAAASAGNTIGWPVVMKLASPDFPHKSDAGLVRLDVSSAEEATSAYDDLVAAAGAIDAQARVDGVVVQQQVRDGVEMIVGATLDPVLGPAVLVGTGGIFAEVLDDVAVRPLPLDAGDAREMVQGLRGHALLAGARGRPPADEEALVEVILAVARLCAAADGRLAELDLNPVLVSPTGATVVDWLAIAGTTDALAHP